MTSPNNLKRLRRASRCTAAEIGAAVGVSGDAIKRWERSEVPPAYEAQLANLFAVSVRHLTGRDSLPRVFDAHGDEVRSLSLCRWLGSLTPAGGCGASWRS